MIKDKLYPFPTILTDRLELRKCENRDINGVYECISNEHVTRYMDMLPVDSYGFAEAYIETMQEGYNKGNCSTWTLCDKVTGDFVGAISLEHFDESAKAAEVGYWIHEKHWNKGYATEAVSAIIKYSFEYLDLHRVSARCFLDNKASIRVLKKAGMTIEGISKDVILKQDVYYDVVWFACVRSKDCM